MSRRDLANLLARVAAEVGGHVDTVAAEIADHLTNRDRTHVVPYRGFGSRTRVLILGRVLAHAGAVSHTRETALGNLLNTVRRLRSEEIPGARLRITIEGATHEVAANAEGYVDAWIDLAQPLVGAGPWLPYDALVTAPQRAAETPAHATGHTLVASASARFGVISDLDDTVIQTNVEDTLAMARAVLLGSARSRLPVPGMGAFYQALHDGASGGERNPLFYVSSSPWNLYDLLHEFLDLHAIPIGPLLLRDWGSGGSAEDGRGHAGFKLRQIRRVLDAHPALPFLLIGDSGQEDPEIYRAVAAEYPGRILGAFIRAVARRPGRDAGVRGVVEDVTALGTTMHLVGDAVAAAEQAAARGWITAAAVARVASQVLAE